METAGVIANARTMFDMSLRRGFQSDLRGCSIRSRLHGKVQYYLVGFSRAPGPGPNLEFHKSAEFMDYHVT